MKSSADGAAPPVTATHLARMLQFGDSMFPIGGFSFSGGLESAVQKRVVTDTASLLAFTRTAVEQAGRGDGIGLVWAHRAALAGDVDELVRIERPPLREKALERDAVDVGADGQEVRRAGRAGDRLAPTDGLARARPGGRDARLLSGGARGQLRRTGIDGARRLRRPPVRRRGHDPGRGAAAHAHQPRRHAARCSTGSMPARTRPYHQSPASARRHGRLRAARWRSSRPSTSRRTCACS